MTRKQPPAQIIARDTPVNDQWWYDRRVTIEMMGERFRKNVVTDCCAPWLFQHVLLATTPADALQ